MSVDVSSQLSISPLDESGRRYAISGLASLCDEYGRYELTVQCAGISSLNGVAGVGGKSVVWTFAEAASPYVIALEGVPEMAVRRLDSLVVVVSAEVGVESVQQARKTLNGLDVTERLTVRPWDVRVFRWRLPI